MDKALTKQVMDGIEKIINDAQDMLDDKRDRYVERDDIIDSDGHHRQVAIVNREAYLQFTVEWMIEKLENLSGEIYDETGVDCDQTWGREK